MKKERKYITLSEAIRYIKEALYALFIYREEEPFDYIRDARELTGFTATERKLFNHP